MRKWDLIFAGDHTESSSSPKLIFVGMTLVFSGNYADLCRGQMPFSLAAKSAG